MRDIGRPLMETLTWSQVIILGIVQGLTEFLPVSSSGHLVILQQLMGIEGRGAFLLDFDLVLHVGTLVSVVAVLYREVWEILESLFFVGRALVKRRTIHWQTLYDHSEGIKLAVMIFVGSIPVAFLGLLFRDTLEGLFTSLLGAGLMLLVTGGILWLSRYFTKVQRPFAEVSLLQSFIVGMAQAFALAPGISRSGMTIVTALGLRWNRELAAKFSFLLLIPAIFGGTLLEMRHFGDWSPSERWIMLTGALTASVTGFFAIKFLVYVVKKGRLPYFAYYCWSMGGLALIYSLIRSFF